MSNSIDDFAVELFEEAKRFLEKARDSGEQPAYLHAAISLGFSALEAHVNSIAAEFSEATKLDRLDLAILKEEEWKLDDGEFRKVRRIYSIEDRLAFLVRRFSRRSVKEAPSWDQFQEALKLRNRLTHPKEVVSIDVSTVKRALNAILGLLNFLFETLYRSKYPHLAMGLDSTLSF